MGPGGWTCSRTQSGFTCRGQYAMGQRIMLDPIYTEMSLEEWLRETGLNVTTV